MINLHTIDQTSIYSDRLINARIKKNVTKLKSLARSTQFDIQSIKSIKNEKEKLKVVSAELESMFVKMMFKSMKKTLSNKSLVSGGQAEKIFDDMLLTERSRQTVDNSSFGIAKMIYEQNSKYLKLK